VKVSGRIAARSLLAAGFLTLLLTPALRLRAEEAASAKSKNSKTPIPTATPKATSGSWGGDDETLPGPDDRPSIVVDPKTKERLERIPKNPVYFVRQGRLFNALLADTEGVPLVREDAKAYYVKALAEPSSAAEEQRKRQEALEADPPRIGIVEISAEEVEVVAPPTSAEKLTLQEISDGLPRTGIWRQTFAIGDLDGDGKPEIVTGPPRLSGQGIRVFKFVPAKKGAPAQWKSVECFWDNPEGIGIGYGGVALGDMDGDGKLDIVFGGHGSGPAVAYNKGKFKFRMETRGLPRLMSTQALGVGDLDGDGKLDIFALSDMPEKLQMGTPQVQPGGYVAGYDARAFINDGTRFKELVTGLENAVAGYSLGLWTKKGDTPFYVGASRYFGNTSVLFTFNRKTLTFERAGDKIIETMALHLAAAVGTYRGLPAAFVSYMKNSPPGATRNADAEGVSIYYKDGEAWKRKRVVKRTGERSGTAGLGVGDLNGDGLDDVVWADEMTHRVRIFFQTPAGEFEELEESREPTFVNHPTCILIADMDGDGHNDIVLMYHYLTGDDIRSGGLRVFRTVR
jgi:FG-GAP-like repeat